MTTVCATSLDRRSHTPWMASKYFAVNGLQQRLLTGLHEAVDDRPSDDVGQRVVLDDQLPGSLLDRELRASRRRARRVAITRGGRITLGLGVDERGCLPVVVDVARGRERGDDAPPQVGVDGQPGQPVLGGRVSLLFARALIAGVQQRGQHGDVPQRQHRRARAR